MNATRLLDLDFKWTPAASTDVTAVWRKYGWVPPSEQPAYLAKWDSYYPARKDHCEMR